MKKALQYNNCFVCGRESKTGLKVEFLVTDEGARAEYTPTQEFEGFKGIVHGGILCALLDEVMWKAINSTAGVLTMTVKMDVRFKRPAKVGAHLFVEGQLTGQKRKLFEAKGTVYNKERKVLAEAVGVFMIVDEATGAQMSEYLSY